MPRPCLGILLAIAFWTSTVHATTINVTTTADELNADGDCSLREAVQAANANAASDACPAGQGDPTVDTIVVPAGTYTLTLAGSNDAGGDLDLRDDVTVIGAGAATTVIQACDVDQLTASCPAGHGVAEVVRAAAQEDARLAGCRQVVQHQGPRRRAGAFHAPFLDRFHQLLQFRLRRPVRQQGQVAERRQRHQRRRVRAVEDLPQLLLGGVR